MDSQEKLRLLPDEELHAKILHLENDIRVADRVCTTTEKEYANLALILEQHRDDLEVQNEGRPQLDEYRLEVEKTSGELREYKKCLEILRRESLRRKLISERDALREALRTLNTEEMGILAESRAILLSRIGEIEFRLLKLLFDEK